ncbi:hypothetical protein ACHHYP_04069 [Achlya hypogyna]|uniref:Secreted protein n=1 Tax=Achlya hypogyna TaxID=1202772 RepID=A0A1V9Z276_ACHHY|nr:hypothetical protein ACHHYP_04069 [Achlya hypogyna]
MSSAVVALVALCLAVVGATDAPPIAPANTSTITGTVAKPEVDVHSMSVPAIVGITAAAVLAVCGLVFMVGVLVVRRWRAQQSDKQCVLSPGTASAQEYEAYFPKAVEPALLEPPARKSSRGSALRKASTTTRPVFTPATVAMEPAVDINIAKDDLQWQSPIESSRYMAADLEAPPLRQSAGWQSPIESSRSLMLLQSQRICELTDEAGFGSAIREEPEVREGTLDSYSVRQSDYQLQSVEWMSATDTSRSIFESMRSGLDSDSEGEGRESLV